MPYMDTVQYKSNHRTPKVVQPLPVIIDTARLQQIRLNADMSGTSGNQDSIAATSHIQNAEMKQKLAQQRSAQWKNTEFSNEDIRIKHLLDHKAALQQEMYDLANAYQERQNQQREQEVLVANKKIEDNSEYSRYLAIARHAADCAAFENERKVTVQQQTEQQQQQDKQYKEFLIRAAEKEKQFKSSILNKAHQNAVQCSDFNQLQARNKTYNKKFGTAEKNMELQEAKYFHSQWEKEQENERLQQLQQKQETKEMYEDYLRREKAKKDQFKLEEKMLYQEEIAIQKAKDEVEDYQKQKEQIYKKQIRDNIAKVQQSAEVLIKQQKEKEDAAYQSMLLARIDGERKRKLQKEWTDHWKQVNQETLEIQQMQEAEKNARQTIEKMQDLAEGRLVIEEVEAERDKQGEIMRKQRELKEKQFFEAKKELEDVLSRKQGAIRKEKEDDRVELQRQMEELNKEKQIPVKAALSENRPEYKQSYQQVIRFMDKTENTVSWMGDLM